MSVLTMQPSALAELRARRSYPAASILAPTHPHDPGNPADDSSWMTRLSAC